MVGLLISLSKLLTHRSANLFHIYYFDYKLNDMLNRDQTIKFQGHYIIYAARNLFVQKMEIWQ